MYKKGINNKYVKKTTNPINQGLVVSLFKV